MKMVNSTTSEIEALDRTLWSTLSMMECFAGRPYCNESERKKVKSMDAIDWFCANARNRLEILRKQGEDRELFDRLIY